MTRTLIRQELGRMRRNWRSVPGLVYRGPADFVLEHGEWFDPVGCRGETMPRNCYANSLMMALQGWTYVEGYAASPELPTGWKYEGQPVVQHAWALDPDGLAWELTWPFPGRAYRGVRFAAGRADQATWDGDATVLDDFKRGWPLLREAWTGEDWTRAWEPTEGLAVLHQALAAKPDFGGRVIGRERT